MDTQSLARAIIAAHNSGSRSVDKSLSSEYYKSMSPADKKEVIKYLSEAGLVAQDSPSNMDMARNAIVAGTSNAAKMIAVPAATSLVSGLWFTRNAPDGRGLLYQTIKKALPTTLGIGALASGVGAAMNIANTRQSMKYQRGLVNSINSIDDEDALNQFMLTGRVIKTPVILPSVNKKLHSISENVVSLSPTADEMVEYYSNKGKAHHAEFMHSMSEGDIEGATHHADMAEAYSNHLKNLGK